MPSKAANIATDSQPAAIQGSGSGRNSVTDSTENATLPQQILAIVQHKWRNLEKRKKKLDEYKKIGDDKLKAEQREALSHFGEVVQLLDLLGDMKKQFETTFTEYESMQKKQAKAEKIAQRKRDVERMREILEVRLVLNTLGDENLRNELRRANKVSDAELALIDKFYEIVEPTSNKSDAFLSSATECFERLLRKEEKPFFEKQTYANLAGVLSRLYQTVTETPCHSQQTVEEPKQNETEQIHEEEHIEANNRSSNQHHKHSDEPTVAENAVRHAPTSPQKHHGEQQSQVQSHQKEGPQATKLEEIVKPGSFSFLQESQISSGGNQHRSGHPRDFVNSNSDQQMGNWVPQRSPGRPEQDGEAGYGDRTNANSAVWNNRSGNSNDANHSYPEQQGGGRNRERNNRQHGQQHHHQQQQQRNRRPFAHSGGADENNEAAAWPQQDDADFSEWKSVDAGSGANRDGGWVGGPDSRRRGGSGGGRGGNGGRGGYHRGGGQNSGQQFGDNRRHFNNRGPRTNQQQRSAAVGGAAGQAYAE